MTGRVDIVDSVGGQPVNSRPEGSGIRLLELQWKGVSMDKNYSEREVAEAGAVAGGSGNGRKLEMADLKQKNDDKIFKLYHVLEQKEACLKDTQEVRLTT